MGLLIQVGLNGLAMGAAYSLVAIGFALIYRVAGFLHFAHGAVYAWAAYMAYFLYVVIGLPLSVTITGSILASALLGAALDIGIHRPLRRRRATPLVFLLASIGTFTVLQNLIPITFGDATQKLGAGVPRSWSVLGGRLSSPQIAIIAAAPLLYAATWYALHRTRAGLLFRAVSSDRELAEVSGLSVDAITTTGFLVGSGLAAVAAVLTALDVDITPVMGIPALLISIVVIVVGGTSNLIGTAMAAVLVGVLQNVAGLLVGARWQDALVYMMLLVILLLRPLGLLGESSTRFPS